MKICVLLPTESEGQFLERDDIDIRYCGVGLTASAYGTLKAIQASGADVIIMGGIAGVYPGRGYSIGETLLVESEAEADLGFFYEDGFRHLADINLDMEFKVRHTEICPYIKDDMPLGRVRSITTNAAMSPYADTSLGDIENMEGSAFFHVCLGEGIRFFEVRSISNEVDLGRSDWDYVGSIKNLTKGINELIEYLLNEDKA